MSNLPAKERIKKYNSDISEMIQKLSKFHEENLKFLNDFFKRFTLVTLII